MSTFVGSVGTDDPSLKGGVGSSLKARRGQYQESEGSRGLRLGHAQVLGGEGTGRDWENPAGGPGRRG